MEALLCPKGLEAVLGNARRMRIGTASFIEIGWLVLVLFLFSDFGCGSGVAASQVVAETERVSGDAAIKIDYDRAGSSQR
jgi:hypothetical protein